MKYKQLLLIVSIFALSWDIPATASDINIGRGIYQRHCVSCHGVNGIAAFGQAPSFAFGERMEKDTGVLLSTILNGHGSMPAWNDKLPVELLEGALEYARTLEDEFRWGIVHTVDEPPDRYFTFGPMSTDFGSAPAERPLSPGSEGPSLDALCAGA